MFTKCVSRYSFRPSVSALGGVQFSVVSMASFNHWINSSSLFTNPLWQKRGGKNKKSVLIGYFLKPILKIPHLIDGKTDTTAAPSYVHTVQQNSHHSCHWNLLKWKETVHDTTMVFSLGKILPFFFFFRILDWTAGCHWKGDPQIIKTFLGIWQEPPHQKIRSSLLGT